MATVEKCSRIALGERQMLREIVIDTETTGLDPSNGDRLIELGCLEIVNRIPTGREFHRYLNPERDIHRDAVAVHGLTGDFLKDKPLFKDIADEFLAFIGEAPKAWRAFSRSSGPERGVVEHDLGSHGLPPMSAVPLRLRFFSCRWVDGRASAMFADGLPPSSRSQ